MGKVSGKETEHKPQRKGKEINVYGEREGRKIGNHKMSQFHEASAVRSAPRRAGPTTGECRGDEYFYNEQINKKNIQE